MNGETVRAQARPVAEPSMRQRRVTSLTASTRAAAPNEQWQGAAARWTQRLGRCQRRATKQPRIYGRSSRRLERRRNWGTSRSRDSRSAARIGVSPYQHCGSAPAAATPRVACSLGNALLLADTSTTIASRPLQAE